MTLDIVVARYNEEVEWTKTFSRVFLYNKGESLPEYREIRLPNVGKEGHTYYTHICENYDNLADYTAFVQGNPFDPFPNLIQHLQRFMETPPTFSFEPLGTILFCCNLSGCNFHQDLPLKKIYEHLFEEKEDFAFTFYGGAQFIVSKEQIRKRPKSFYQKIVNLLNKEVNPIEGYVIERFHPFVFK
jgi:hypothetical protein